MEYVLRRLHLLIYLRLLPPFQGSSECFAAGEEKLSDYLHQGATLIDSPLTYDSLSLDGRQLSFCQHYSHLSNLLQWPEIIVHVQIPVIH